MNELALGAGLEISRIGLGTLRIANAGLDRGRDVLRRAVALGTNLIDTADAYGEGAIEQLIASALHPYPDGVVIATKGGQVLVDGEPRPDCRPEHLRAACEASLRRLRLDRIDLYQLHNPDPAVPLEDSLGALAELRAEGKIRSFGVSNLYGPAWPTALSAGAISLQNNYSVGERGSQAELDRCERDRVAFLAYFPLAAGAFARDKGALGSVAAAHGATPAQIALAWLLHSASVTVPIPCTTSIEHLEQNIRAAEIVLSSEDLELLG